MATEPAQQTIAQQLKHATLQLEVVSGTPRLDAELLLCQVLDWPRTTLYTRGEHDLSADHALHYQTLLAQRCNGMPVAYLVQAQEFWSLPLLVNDAVLIPRADTELLVETLLHLLDDPAATVLDLGTGSGAIALALASEQSALAVTASDTSAPALAVARQNAQNLGLTSVTFLQSHWFTSLAGRRFDFIVSNPPYIREGDPHLQDTGVKFEPRLALVSGHDGLDAIRHIAEHARQHLGVGGKLLLEHGYDQGRSVCTILKDCQYSDVVTLEDATGNARVTHGTYHGE